MVWLFKPKMTVDHCSGVVAGAIEENIAIYNKALSEHAAENISEVDRSNLQPELWALDLSVLNLALLATNFPREMGTRLISMIVVGSSPLRNELYIQRSHYYGPLILNGPREEVTIRLSRAFLLIAKIRFVNERPGVNPKALEWAIGVVATGSLTGLSSLIADITKQYRIY